MQINAAACKTTLSHTEIGSFVLIINGLAIKWRRLISNSTKLFYVCTCVTGCSTTIPIDIQ